MACREWEDVLRLLVAHGQRYHTANTSSTSSGRVVQQGFGAVVEAAATLSGGAVDYLLHWWLRLHRWPFLDKAHLCFPYKANQGGAAAGAAAAHSAACYT